jgi:hypothetical protein
VGVQRGAWRGPAGHRQILERPTTGRKKYWVGVPAMEAEKFRLPRGVGKCMCGGRGSLNFGAGMPAPGRGYFLRTGVGCDRRRKLKKGWL